MAFQVTPFIMLDGNAKEAIQFYERSLDAKVIFTQTFGEGPEIPEHSLMKETNERLAHSVLKIGDADLFVADTLPGQPNQSGNRVQSASLLPILKNQINFSKH